MLAADLGKYLGVPLHHHRVNRRSYKFLEEKLCNCLSKWKVDFLSLAGKITLTKSALNTILIYYMQTNLLPNSTCERIDKISRDFLWGNTEAKKGTHLIAWDKLCRPKNEGGIGLRKASLMNQALFMKVGWGLISKRDTLWARTLRGKYGCRTDVIPKVGRRNCNSNLWTGVCKVWNRVLDNTNWKIGNNKLPYFWKDCWFKNSVCLMDLTDNFFTATDLEETVSDFLLPNGEWDIEKLRNYLPEDIVRKSLTSRLGATLM